MRVRIAVVGLLFVVGALFAEKPGKKDEQPAVLVEPTEVLQPGTPTQPAEMPAVKNPGQPRLLAQAGALKAVPGRVEQPKVRQQLEALRIWQLTQDLNLSEEQSAMFFPKLRKVRECRDRFRRNRYELMSQLSSELNAKSVSDRELSKTLASLQELEDQYRQEERQMNQELCQMLTVQQQARLYLFQANFERQTRRMIEQIQSESESKPPTKPGRGNK